jgi:hypothetical protein
MDGLTEALAFLDAIFKAAPVVVPAAAAIAVLINILKVFGIVKDVETGALLTAPRVSLVLNFAVYTGLLIARHYGAEAEVLGGIDFATEVLPGVLIVLGALYTSYKTHQATKAYGLAPKAAGDLGFLDHLED